MSKSTRSENTPSRTTLAPQAAFGFDPGMLDSYGHAWSSYLAAWQRCGQELADFAVARLRKDTELGESLSQCRSWSEAADLQTRWMRETTNDYVHETEKVMKIVAQAGRDGGSEPRRTARTKPAGHEPAASKGTGGATAE